MENSETIYKTSPVVSKGLSLPIIILFAVAAGMSVANVYYAQPLLDAMAGTFGISQAAVGMIITFTQVGYGVGLLLLVPLGDLVDSRKLIIAQLGLLSLFLVIVALAPAVFILLGGMIMIGLLAVVTQTLVAFVANMANDNERGRVVGTVTSGIITGILLARTISGTLADLAGWRSVYFVSAAMTLLIAIILFRVAPVAKKPQIKEAYPQLLKSVFVLFANEPVLLARGIIAMLIFAAGTVLWTPMVLPLSAPPFSLSHTEIGLFGLAGVAGALGATRAGRLADRGFAQWTSGIGLTLVLLSWIPTAMIAQSLWGLVIGVIIFDFGLQAVHVTNQSIILKVRPEARSRITGGYMVFYAIGSGAGSIASTTVFAHAGWMGVCILGASISALALLWWGLSTRF
jgi:predicted MFS family arabinose efflux permease